MTPRQEKILVHKHDPSSETDVSISSGDEAEIAEIAEIANFKYSKKQLASRNHQRRSENRQKRLNMAQADNQSLSSESSQSSSLSLTSQDLPILNIMNPDRSPPLNRSHYLKAPRHESGAGDKKPFPIYERTSTVDSNERLGFRALTSGSRTPDNLNQIRKRYQIHRTQSSPDVKAALSSAMVPIGLCEFIGEGGRDGTIGGLQKLFKNLNIAEKMRQQKIEQQRLNIHNLPPHMKQQLKNIYVY